ncbi:hypothetical protein [Prescottella equi]|uniref:hypothetical protein n=1 Tax=Rhodococcus hoagii TaxID=43767 RepID=UPI000D10FA21|nr:hypothetical protein [Prescottella equi]AVP71303.1 hypothetical protein C7H75_24790 [Prescottella equi]
MDAIRQRKNESTADYRRRNSWMRLNLAAGRHVEQRQECGCRSCPKCADARDFLHTARELYALDAIAQDPAREPGLRHMLGAAA